MNAVKSIVKPWFTCLPLWLPFGLLIGLAIGLLAPLAPTAAQASPLPTTQLMENPTDDPKDPMEQATQAVVQLFNAVDTRHWQRVTELFAPEVLLDYSSYTGQPAATLPPQAIVDAWKGLLPGFEHTHHQLGNFTGQVNGNTATVECYGTASHYLPHEKGDLLTVVGTYTLQLTQNEGGHWQIDHMTFHFKYQSGNAALLEAAMANAKK